MKKQYIKPFCQAQQAISSIMCVSLKIDSSHTVTGGLTRDRNNLIDEDEECNGLW